MGNNLLISHIRKYHCPPITDTRPNTAICFKYKNDDYWPTVLKQLGYESRRKKGLFLIYHLKKFGRES